MKPIPYGKQNIKDDDIRAVIDVLRSDFLTQGPQISHFENAFSKYVNSSFLLPYLMVQQPYIFVCLLWALNLDKK